jgi:hypothetical protein
MMRFVTTFLVICALALVASAQQPKKERQLLPKHRLEQRSAGSFTYMYETLSQPYNDLTNGISVNNGEIWDDPDYVIGMPFPFYVNGAEVTALLFTGLGAGLFGITAEPGVFEALNPFEVDLIDRGAVGGVSQSPISYEIEGEPGNQIFKLEWKNAGSYDEMDALGTTEMFVNLQLWLYENTDAIEVHYGSSSITDPDLFYFGETGAFVGFAGFDANKELIWGDHFLTGPADAPTLVELDPDFPPYLDGTPSDGIVYRFYQMVQNDLEILMLSSDGTCGESNGTATAEVSGGEEPYSYAWSTGDTTQTIENLGLGSYTVTVTDNIGSTGTASAQIFVAEVLLANAGSTDETSSGADDGTAWSEPSGGVFPYTFEWSNGATNPMIFDLAPGSYTITVTDDDGCTAWETVVVNAFDCPEVTIEVGLSNLNCFGSCDASIVILDINGGAAPYDYQWSDGSTQDFINGLCAGTYILTLTDADGCTYVETYEIFEPEQLLPNAGSSDETAEDANDGTAWAAPTGGVEPYSYVWNNGSTDSLITGLAPGFYWVTVTDANECNAVQTVVVNGFGCALDFDAIITATCNEACTGSITLTPVSGTPPFDYLWYDGSTGDAVSGLCEGVYSVTVTDADGCIYVSTYFLFDLEPVTVITGSTGETGLGLNDGTAWSEPSGGLAPYTYVWSNGSTDSLIVDLEPGTYFVTVTDANGCSIIGETTVLPFTCVGFLVSTVNPVSCHGGCDGALSVAAIGGIGPFHYLWNTGDTTQVIEGICADTYTVLITDEGQGCNALTSFELTEPDFIDGNVDEVVHITDSTEASISITVFGGTPPYTFDWHSYNGTFTSTDEDVSGMPADYYFVFIRDANNCEFDLDSIQILDLTVGTKDLGTLRVNVYPNPASNHVIFDVADVTDYELQLISSDGMTQRTWRQTNTIDVTQFIPGIYIVLITSDEGRYTGRLTIVH